MVNDHCALLYGGEQSGSGKTNDVYKLDLSKMVSYMCIVLIECCVVLIIHYALCNNYYNNG